MQSSRDRRCKVRGHSVDSRELHLMNTRDRVHAGSLEESIVSIYMLAMARVQSLAKGDEVS